MTTLNLTRIAELLALDRERTPGDWFVHRPHKHPYIRNEYGVFVMEPRPYSVRADHDAAFIAAAPELAEQLRLAVAEVERLEKSVRSYQIAFAALSE